MKMEFKNKQEVDEAISSGKIKPGTPEFDDAIDFVNSLPNPYAADVRRYAP